MSTSSPALGIRLNNPLNIRESSDAWEGKVGSDSGFVQFDTPESGVRAAARLFTTYKDKHGINTIDGLIGRWAPPEDNNDTEKYINHVSAKTGMKRDQQIDLADPETIRKILPAMIQMETNAPIDALTLNNGIARATNGAVTQTPVLSRNQNEQVAEKFQLASQYVNPLDPQMDFGQSEFNAKMGRDDPSDKTPSFFSETLPAAWELQSEFVTGKRAMESLDYSVDPDWTPAKITKEDFDGIPTALLQDGRVQEELSNTVSRAHFEQKLRYLKEETAALGVLEKAGMRDSILSSLLVSLTNPSTIATTAASMALTGTPAAGAATTLNAVSRVKRMLQAGAIESALGTAVETVNGSQRIYKPVEDYYAAAGMSFVFGGAARGFIDTVAAASMARNAKKIVADHTADPAQTPVANAVSNAVGTPPPAGTPVAGLPEHLQAHVNQYGNMADPMWKDGLNMSSVTQGSDNPFVRSLGNMFFQNYSGRSGPGTINAQSADLIKSTKMAEWSMYVKREQSYHYDQWLKETNAGSFAKILPNSRISFENQVAEYMLSMGAAEVKPAAKQYAERIGSLYAKIRQEAIDVGVKGADAFPENPYYFSRRWDGRAIQHAVGAYGRENVVTLLAEAMVRMQPHLAGRARGLGVRGSPENIASRVLETLERKGSGVAQERGFVGSSPNDTAYVMRNLGFSDDEVDEVMEGLWGIKDSKSTTSTTQFKRRIAMDEFTSIKVKDLDGTVKDLAVKDLFNTNVTEVTMGYVNNLSGRIGLAKVGITDKTDFDALVGKAREWASVNNPQSFDKRINDIIETGWRHLTGVPLTETDEMWKQTGRVLRGLEFAKRMGLLAFSMAAEVSKVIMIPGIKAAAKQLPAIPGMLMRIRGNREYANQLKHTLSRELELFGALPDSRWFDPVGHSWGDPEYGRFVARTGAGIGTKAYNAVGAVTSALDRPVGYAQKATSALSHGFDMALKRWASSSVAQNFVDLALGKSKLNGIQGLSKARLNDMGIDEAMAARITKEIKANVKVGSLGRAHALNLDQWTDTQARETFIYGIRKIAYGHIIQETDIGTSMRWMHSDIGKMLFQFRTFQHQALWKQVVNNVALMRNDPTEIARFMLMVTFGSILGGMSWAAAYGVRKANDDSVDWDEKFSLENIIKNGFARTAEASYFPVITDTVAQFLNYNPLFQDSRNSGLSQGLFDPNAVPVLSTLNNAAKAASGTVNALTDDNYTYTRDDFKATRGALAILQNVPPIVYWLDAVEKDLPPGYHMNKHLRRGD